MLQTKEEIKTLAWKIATALSTRRGKQPNVVTFPMECDIIEDALRDYVGANTPSRPTSIYSLTCVCGIIINSTNNAGMCACGRHWSVR